MPHEDGAAYAPVVATISLGSSIVLDMYDKVPDGDDSNNGPRTGVPSYRILQEPRSLLLTTGDMYSKYLHGIAERQMDEDIGPFDPANRSGVVNWDLLGNREQIEFNNGRLPRSTRVSLTYRDVLKVKEVGKSLKFLKSGR